MKNITLDYDLMNRLVKQKIKNENLQVVQLHTTAKVSRSTYYRLQKREPLTMHTFLALVNWLNHPVEKFFKK